MLAALRITIPNQNIDDENGIIPGCRLAEVNRLAVFAGADGKPTEIYITPKLIDELLGLATTRGRLDAYFTHDRLNAENRHKDALHDSIGVWRNFRKDENGNLIADSHLAPTQYRERILWQAHNDPSGIMTSCVFDYTGGKDDAKAVALNSCDFVKEGAATTALLSAYSQTAKLKTMDINELITALDDPKVLAALKAIIKSVEKAQADNSTDDSAADSTESEAGVTDADKTDSDKDKPAFMRAALRIQRATIRKVSEAQTAAMGKVSDEAVVKAEAKLTSIIGAKVTHAINAGANSANDFESAVQAQIAAGAKGRGAAIARVAKDKPEVYNAAMKAGAIK